MKDKLRFIFRPFVLTLIGLTFGYTFLNWLLIIKLNLFHPKEIVINLGIPMALAALAAWVLLRPSLKILRLELKNNRNLRDLYSFIIFLALFIPLFNAQEYIASATGKLTQLNSIEEIEKLPPTKYYTLKSFYIDKNSIGRHSTFEASGKYNEHLQIHIYFALPIFVSEKDTSENKPFAWLGIKYDTTISNGLNNDEKELSYQKFSDESYKKFAQKKVSEFVYLTRVPNSDFRDGYLSAIRKNPIYVPNDTILTGVNEAFEARNGKKMAWLVGSLIVGSLVWLLMCLVPKTNESQLNRIKAGKPDKKAQRETKEFLQFLTPREGHFITPILIFINVGVFLLLVVNGFGFISFKGQDLLHWGANYGPRVRNGEWWRLLTCTFLHGGVMHLLGNVVGLTLVAMFLEPLLGRIKYLMAYLSTGILASLTSIWWHDATVSVGASGAIFGLYGIFIALLLTNVYPKEVGRSLILGAVVFVGFNLCMGFAGAIDNAAHIGGLLSGFILGLILTPSLKRQAESQ